MWLAIQILYKRPSSLMDGVDHQPFFARISSLNFRVRTVSEGDVRGEPALPQPDGHFLWPLPTHTLQPREAGNDVPLQFHLGLTGFVATKEIATLYSYAYTLTLTDFARLPGLPTLSGSARLLLSSLTSRLPNRQW
jgi:hypothetical protein